MNQPASPTLPTPPESAKPELIVERIGHAGLITLNRPKALNALSPAMVKDLLATLMAWRDDPAVWLVGIRGTNKAGRPGTPESLFGNFCAGGDIRYFHQAALAGAKVDEKNEAKEQNEKKDQTDQKDQASAASAAKDELGDYFTVEYTLNHLIQTYPKPYIAFLDGVVMGGGMGLCQGAAHSASQPGKVRIVTEHTKMAMPETQIGLFPDVGGGYFLSRCPGHVGEYLALTGNAIGAEDAVAYGLADVQLPAASLPAVWLELGQPNFASAAAAAHWITTKFIANNAINTVTTGIFDPFFSLLRVKHIVDALEKAATPWSIKTAAALRKRSPLMLHVTLEHIRRARHMSLADDLRMERDMIHQCFHLRPGAQSETVEGIRALAIDKDYSPQWSPARIEDVKPGMADAFFVSPWAADAHPLGGLT